MTFANYRVVYERGNRVKIWNRAYHGCAFHTLEYQKTLHFAADWRVYENVVASWGEQKKVIRSDDPKYFWFVISRDDGEYYEQSYHRGTLPVDMSLTESMEFDPGGVVAIYKCIHSEYE